MAINPLEHQGASLLDHVDAALKGLGADLEPGDFGVIAVTREAAMAWDLAKADGKALSAMNYLSYVNAGLEKLGGSAMARKALGKKADRPKAGLAAVRALHAVQDPKPAAKTPATRKPRTPRAPKAKGA